MVVTGDRDMFQLIEPGIRVMATSRGITETKIYDRDAVVDRYGIPPEKIPDFYGLKGDTSDNIPGVPGIGDKTASDLLQRFDTLENVLASVDEISGAKRKQNLIEHADNARMSKELATAVRDVPVEVDLAHTVSNPPDRSRLRETFREFELREPLRRIEEALADQEEGEVPRSRHRGDDRRARHRGAGLRARAARRRAGRTCGGAPGDRRAHAQPAARLRRLCRRRRGARRADRDARCAHAVLGRPAGGRARLEDDRHRRGALRRASARARHDGRRLPARPSRPRLPAARDRRARGDRRERRGGQRARRARRAHAGAGRAAARRDRGAGAHVPLPRRGAAARRRARRDGAHRREARHRPPRHHLREGRASGSSELERDIYQLAGEEFTIGSPQQLGQILFEKLQLSRKRRGKTGFSTDARVLQAIRSEHEIIPSIEEWREYSKLKSTYLDALPLLVDSESRLHTTFNQTATTTGRLSMHRSRTCRTSRSAPSWGARSASASSRRRAGS